MQEETKSQEEVNNAAPDNKELNFRKLENKYERLLEEQKRKAEEYARKLEELEKKVSSSDDDDDDEPYVDSKKLNKTLAAFQQNLEKNFEKKAEEKALSLLAEREQSQYIKENPDFKEMMSAETLEKFATEHPRIAENILRMPNTFERQKLVYETMKELKVTKEKSQESSIQDRINQNKRSPYYQPSGISNSPYSAQGDFSPTGKQQAYEKMKELQRNLRIG